MMSEMVGFVNKKDEEVNINSSYYYGESGCMQPELQYLWSGHLGTAKPDIGAQGFNTNYIDNGTKEINRSGGKGGLRKKQLVFILDDGRRPLLPGSGKQGFHCLLRNIRITANTAAFSVNASLDQATVFINCCDICGKHTFFALLHTVEKGFKHLHVGN